MLNPYEQIAEYSNGMFNFSFPTSLQWMEERGKILFGNHFSIAESDYKLIYKLLVYAIGIRKTPPDTVSTLKKEFYLEDQSAVERPL